MSKLPTSSNDTPLSNNDKKPVGNSANEDTGTQAEDRGKGGHARFQFNDVYTPLLEAIAGFSFISLLGEYLDNLGFHHKPFFTFAALTAVECAIAHLFVKAFGAKQKVIWTILAMIVGIELLAAVALRTGENPKPTAKFIFLAGSAKIKSMKRLAVLTNEFLINNDFGKGSSPLGFVVVPIEAHQDNFPLVFFVQNMSPSETARDIDVTASFADNWSLIPGADWKRVDNGAHFVSNNVSIPLNSWAWTYRDAVLPGNGMPCPAFFISTRAIPFNNDVIITARCPGSPAFAIKFHLHFAVIAPEIISLIWKKELKPFVVLGKRNSDGDVYFDYAEQQIVESQK